ncbi:HK97 family phage prohead protease [Xanthobacter sp. V2C-8]|uniref:HK97 family phage prohead protease n=1 Tax=Xanthobacter albus TaxID=3119929 RepID=UPI0037290368
MPLDHELRSFMRPVEAREDGGRRTVHGYAAVFDQPAEIAGEFLEVIAPGAFAETLRSADVRAYFDHDQGRILGRTSAGTLRLREDATGLAVEIDLPDTTDGRDARELISRGDVSGMSFAFVATREAWDFSAPLPRRTVQAVDLIEVSIVSAPAYEGTSVALRSRETARASHNFSAAARRLRMKATLDLRARSKA